MEHRRRRGAPPARPAHRTARPPARWRTVTATGPTCVAANTATTAAWCSAPTRCPGSSSTTSLPGSSTTDGRVTPRGRLAHAPRGGDMTDGPLLWFLNRGTGLVLLVLLTAHGPARGPRHPRRGGRPGAPVRHPGRCTATSALLSVVLLLAHVASAVADEYVDIRWWQAVLPVRRDLPAALARARHPGARPDGRLVRDQPAAPPDRAPALARRAPRRTPRGRAAVAHGLGIGTDSSSRGRSG